MNLEDVIDPEAVNSVHSLQQDNYSLSGVAFGEENQLQVVGWSGRNGSNKFYILKCSKCSQDSELFGDGYFRDLKGNLVRGIMPCGCGRSARWSQEQCTVRCSRRAKELGYTFLGFIGEWKGAYTKIKMSCEKHGEWDSGIIHHLINKASGCPGCKTDAAREVHIKPTGAMIASFQESGAFHPDTKFWRSERLTSQGHATFWHMYCPECMETGEAVSSSLQEGHRPCACNMHRQQECYINWIIDEHENAIAIKFGIARDSKQRIKQQDSKCVYTLKQHAVYTFPSVQQCKQAERECKQELECGVVLKRDMKDGHTETTWSYNLDKIIEIYERNEGTLEWQNKTL